MVDPSRGSIHQAASHDPGNGAAASEHMGPPAPTYDPGADGIPDRPATAHARGPHLVPLEVARSKFAEQLQRWEQSGDIYTRRGWVLLQTSDLQVDVAFMRNVPMAGRQVPVVAACVRINYWNFDIWPPSVTFIDPVTREPSPPPVRAPEFAGPAGEARDVLIDGHPTTGQPFLCLPGIREYHSHPQHSGDNWLLHRQYREGDLVVICERIWRRMSRNVLGVGVAMQLLPIGAQLEVSLLQGDADLMDAQIEAQASVQWPTQPNLGVAKEEDAPRNADGTLDPPNPSSPLVTAPIDAGPDRKADQPHA